jgi:hypothetical protein
MAIVAGIALVQTVLVLVKGLPPGRMFMHLGVWTLAMPVQMAVLSFTFDLAAKRRIGPTRLIVESLLVGGALSGAFTLSLVLVAERFLGLDPGFPEKTSYPIATAFGVVIGFLLCGVWALAFVYPYSAEQSRLRSLEADRLRLEADQLRTAAEVARLRSQLEPHFLLNTLNAIAGLVTQDPRAARRLIGSLGDLFRDSLHDEDELQPLEREISWLRRYTNILESRHGSALSFVWEISEETRGLLLPRLLLQPLVENAVQHGALQRTGGGSVTVRTFMNRGPSSPTLVCVVADDGPGLSEGATRADAFGLHAVRRRLELKYPTAELRLESSRQGTRSIVELPVIRDAVVHSVTGEPARAP